MQRREDEEHLDAATSPSPDEKRGIKRRVVNESVLDDEEAKRLEARRAYNRLCAAKARKRSKDLISTLQDKVTTLSKEKTALEHSIEVLRAQIQFLERQNNTLLISQRSQPMMQAPSAQSNQDTSLFGAIDRQNSSFLMNQRQSTLGQQPAQNSSTGSFAPLGLGGLSSQFRM